MKKAGLLLTLLAGAGSGWAQTSPYHFSTEIEAQLKGDKPGKNQFGAWDYSRIGEYQKALATWDLDFGRPSKLVPADSAAFVAYHTTNARDYILKQARSAQIVIINEAHHNPRHRVFAASLLAGLAKEGFRYLGAEAIVPADSLLNRRGYPVLATGFYVAEPSFGNLLRTARQAGYHLFGYDADGAGGPGGREIAQARNIQKVLAADPKARFVIYCGFAHVNEGPNGMGNGPAMAARLKEYTGIDPFTIDQVQLTESASPDVGNPLYHLIKGASSSVFLNEQGQAFNRANAGFSADVDVYHPRTTYQSGRPAWLLADKQPVPVARRISIAFPCLVQAYKQGEDAAQDVPVDVIELQASQDAKALALAPGLYTILVRNQQGQTQTFQLKQ